jgi:hypothetical protein
VDSAEKGEEVKVVSLDRKSNSTLVNLNTKIYKIDKVLKVAQTFSDICWVNVDGDVGGMVQVKLKPKSKGISIKKIGYEFFNHVLAEMKISEDIQ